MKVIAEVTWTWMLIRHDDGTLYLSVVCGTVGIYTIDLQLTDDEAAEYLSAGLTAMDRLARDVFNQPSNYRARHIQNFDDLPGLKAAVSNWRTQSERS